MSDFQFPTGVGYNPSVGENGEAIPGYSTMFGIDVGGDVEPVSESNPLPVSGSFSAGAPADNIATGTASSDATVVTINTEGCASCIVTVVLGGGGFSGLLVFQATTDGTNYKDVFGFPTLYNSSPNGPVYDANSAAGQWVIPCGGYKGVQIVCQSYGSGSATVTLESSAAPQYLFTGLFSGGGFPIGSDDASDGAPNGLLVTLKAGPSSGANVIGTVIGGMTNNFNVPPTAQLLGVVPAVANATAPTLIEGYAALHSLDLNGNLRVVQQGQPYTLQKTNGVTTGGAKSSLAITYSNNVKLGTTLIMVVAWGTITNPTSVLDTQGNLWQQATIQQGAAYAIAVYYAKSKTAGANTVTFTPNASCSVAAQIYEVSGLAPGSVPDCFTVEVGTAALTMLSGGAIVTSQPNDFFVVGLAVGLATSTFTMPGSTSVATITGNLTNDSGNLNPGTPSGLYSFAAGSGILSSPYSFPTNTVLASQSTSEAYTTIVVCFKPYQSPDSGVTIVAGSQGGAPFGVSSVGATVTNAIPVSLGAGAVADQTGQVQGMISGNASLVALAVGVMKQTGSPAATAATMAYERTPSVFQGGVVQAQIGVLWTPQIGKKIRLMRYRLEVGEDATASALTSFNVGFTFSLPKITVATGINPYGIILPTFAHRFTVPSSVLATGGNLWDSDWVDLGNGFENGNASTATNLGQLLLGINSPQPATGISPTFTIATTNQWEAATIGFTTVGNLGTARLRQCCSGVGVGTAASASLDMRGGSAILVAVRTTNIAAGVPTITVTDTQGNTYTALAITTNASDSANGSSLQLFYVLGVPASLANTITATTTTHVATITQMWVLEVVGVVAIDATSRAATTGSSAAPASGSYSPTSVGDYLITVFASECAGVALTAAPTISAGWTMRGTIFSASGAICIADNFGNGSLTAGCVNALTIGTEE